MSEVEYGPCDICKHVKELSRKYYHYDIKCECHSPKHFELIRYCSDCTPKQPIKTTINITPINI